MTTPRVDLAQLAQKHHRDELREELDLERELLLLRLQNERLRRSRLA